MLKHDEPAIVFLLLVEVVRRNNIDFFDFAEDYKSVVETPLCGVLAEKMLCVLFYEFFAGVFKAFLSDGSIGC